MSAKQFARVWLLALLVSEPGRAHTPVEGIEDFYNGLLHPVLVPVHLLRLTAVRLLIGQQGIAKKHAAFSVFLVTTAIGLVGPGSQ